MDSTPGSYALRGAVIGFLGAVTMVLVTRVLPFQSAEERARDLWMAVRPPLKPAESILIVAIDDRSVQQLGELPWSKSVFADLVNRLHEYGARTIVLDELMPVSSVSDEGDEARLAEAMTAAGNVVVPFHFSREEMKSSSSSPQYLPRGLNYIDTPSTSIIPARALIPPPPSIAHAAAAMGHVNVYPELDGKVRRLPVFIDYRGRPYPSLALAAACHYLRISLSDVQVWSRDRVVAGPIQVSVNEAGEVLLNFAGEYGTFPQVSAADVMEGAAQADEFRDRLVIIGRTGAQITRLFPTALGPVFPGVEIQATAIDNLLSSRALHEAPPSAVAAYTLIAGLVLGGAATRLALGAVTTVAGILLALPVLMSFSSLVRTGLWIDPVRPVVNIAVIFICLVLYRLRVREKESNRVQSIVDTLVYTSGILSSSMDQDRLLQLMLNWTDALVGAQASSILLLDEDAETLRFRVATGPVSDKLAGVTVPVGQGIAGWVAENAQPVLVEDALRDERFKREIADSLEFPTRSIICAPLEVKGRVLGVLEVVNRLDGSSFTPADLELLTALASQTAVVIENARLYSLLERRVELANQELVDTNARLAAEKAKLETIMTSMSDGVIVTDESNAVILVNPAARVFLQLPAGELLGRRIDDLTDRAEVSQLFARVAGSDGGSAEGEIAIDTEPARTLQLRVAAVETEDGGRLGVVAVLSDITQLKELSRLKSDFVSFVSHELKAPLTSIKGFAATLLRTEGIAREEQKRFLSVIDRECDRMTRLINNLLDASRIEAGVALELTRESVNLQRLLSDVIDRQSVYADGHDLQLEVDDDLPEIEADPDKLEQVFVNLVNNAIKYSPNGGAITVAARRANGGARISVRDHGLGIPADQQDHLFERYRRVDRNGAHSIRGTGLGLFLTRHLVQAHGGRIWFESVEGEGSEFTVELPARAGESQP